MSIPLTERQSDRSYELPERYLWTRDEFERAGESGVFTPGERLELIEGEIIRKVAPMKTPHASALRLANKALNRVFRDGYTVDVQLPLALGERSEPEPDLSVQIGNERDFIVEHPITSVLIVEIADSSLRLDRTLKANLYARAGIQDYWIVNLNDRVLEVHREPGPMADQPLGYHYHSITRLTATDSITALAEPDTAVAVADLLP